LLHTRLAIQDLSSAGHQPMRSRDGRWWLTFNGELYTHHELRAGLGVSFRGSSDTETLVELLAHDGIERALPQLNGIFAFGALDTVKGRLYLVRDPFGVKPLYYTLSDSLTFASEIKPLLDGGPGTLDSAALQQFLALRYTPSPATLLDGIRRLPPGHVLELDLETRRHRTRCYALPTNRTFEGSLEDATQAYRQALDTAVERQLLSDVPVGVLLSGGIDSAVVAAMARKHCPDLTSYTVGFGPRYAECELADAAETARVLGIPHHTVTVRPESLLELLPEIVRAVEEPLGTTSVLAMWALTQEAKRHVTVVLTGQGNDEPWGGYRRHQLELVIAAMPWLKTISPLLSRRLIRRIRSEGGRRALYALRAPSFAHRLREAYALFTDDQIMQLAGAVDPGPALWACRYWLDWLAPAGVNDAERMLRIDTRMGLADDLLLYGDKISMAFALEARVPMLDPELVELIESMPLDYRVRLRKTKIVHKHMATNFLPERIVQRKKRGFQVPFGEWSKTVWRDFIEAHLLDPRLGLYRHLDYGAVTQVWDAHNTGRRDYARQIFALLSLALWVEAYL